MRILRWLFVLVALPILTNLATADEFLLEWPNDLRAGSPHLVVKHYLEDRGIQVAILKGGLTYTSKISTPQRDYLFCNDKLSNLVEGEQVDGSKFNRWITTFFALREKHGDPEVDYEDGWRQIKFRWTIPSDTKLYLLIRAAAPDKIIWTKELVHEPSSGPCR